jgi:NAD(P)-dependent dehydrogenase (short-subunit alcohol dehydrogenase family)
MWAVVTETRLSGQVALVTGATEGIGESIVRRLPPRARPSWPPTLDAERCEKLAWELTGGAMGLRLDVTDETAWATVVAQVTDRLGSLSVLVNNAGIAARGTVETETQETWERVIGVTQTRPGSEPYADGGWTAR